MYIYRSLFYIYSFFIISVVKSAGMIIVKCYKGRNMYMSTIKDEEALHQNLKNLW